MPAPYVRNYIYKNRGCTHSNDDNRSDIRFFVSIGVILILAAWKLVELMGWCLWTAFHHYR